MPQQKRASCRTARTSSLPCQMRDEKSFNRSWPLAHHMHHAGAPRRCPSRGSCASMTRPQSHLDLPGSPNGRPCLRRSCAAGNRRITVWKRWTRIIFAGGSRLASRSPSARIARQRPHQSCRARLWVSATFSAPRLLSCPSGRRSYLGMPGLSCRPHASLPVFRRSLPQSEPGCRPHRLRAPDHKVMLLPCSHTERAECEDCMRAADRFLLEGPGASSCCVVD